MSRSFAVVWLLLGCICAISVAIAAAGDVAFRKHVIDADAQFTAAAVFDVNHDGKLDIVCGSHWYEAPTWKKHFVRDVEQYGNPPRYDGYAHLPLDVNGDGWIDVITVNYRSRSLKWLEHPGAGLGPWTAHTIDEPGPMETGRLVDIDGDGQLDILPNGVQAPGWWELVREPNASRGVTPRWVRHDLPREVAGHGVGFGDIDGDGRGDIVGPRGWLQGPPDARKDRWQWHGEFDLDSASIPILVVDVNGDGHNDIVWGRGHNFGLYWLEQDASDPMQRRWIKHVIDTSWGGAHSPLWADLDGDGVPELIAGKRYLPHEGRDPGEYDPMVAYRYQFDRTTRTWKRWPITVQDNVALGLDPKVIDLDGDGDQDLLCADRCGLYWLENSRISSNPTPAAAEPTTPAYDDRTQLMSVKDREGISYPVTTPFDWGLRRAHILASIEAALGKLHDSYERVPLELKVGEERQAEGFVRKRISFATEPGVRINAELLQPSQINGKAPAVLCLQSNPEVLARRGYICLVPESSGAAGVAKSIWSNMRAIDLLETLPEVNIDALGCVGSGPAARLALCTAAFDQRIAATVCSGEIDGDELPAKNSSPAAFSLHELLAAVAPRGIWIDTPLDEQKTKQAVAAAGEVFKLRGVESKLRTANSAPPKDSTGLRAEAGKWLDSVFKK